MTTTSYERAERFCDEWAGDNQAHVVVLEDFNAEGWFIVVDIDAAERLLADPEQDMEIQYQSNCTPEHMAAML